MHKQGSQEWLDARLGMLTGSRLARALAKTGKGWSDKRAGVMFELLAEQLTGESADSYVSKDMQWGRDYEADARRMYEVTTGNMVSECGLIEHPTIKGLGASPDGLIDDDGLLEIKCPKTTTHLQYIYAGVVPEAYTLQMDLQLLCTQRKWCDFASYDPRMKLEDQMSFIIRYEPSADHLKSVEDQCVVFLAELAALRQTIEGKQ